MIESPRFLHKEWFEFVPELKLVLYTNYRPRIDGSDGAVWDRVKLIPFNVSFAEARTRNSPRSSRLSSKESSPGPRGGLPRVGTRDGLGSCDAVERATQQYRQENDTLGTFFDDCCEFGEGYAVSRADLRAACEDFVREQGEEPPAAAMIGRGLATRGINAGLGRKDRTYRGVRLLGEESR